MRAAAELGLGVVAMNPLSGGMIPRDPARFSFLRRQGDPSVVAGALRFLVLDPRITVALVGFASEREVDEAVEAALNADDDGASFSELQQHLERGFAEVCTGCGYCLPCPQGIPIPRYMDAYNVRVLGGTDDEIRDRFFWHWSIRHDHAGDCSECGDCEARCTQHLPIRERLRRMPKPRPE